MPYCTITDVRALIASTAIDPNTLPTDAQTLTLIALKAGEIDTALTARGYAVPITTTGLTGGKLAAVTAFLEELKLLNAKGAAHLVLCQAEPVYIEGVATQHPAANAHGDAFTARIVELQEGIGVPVGLPRYEIDTVPRGYLTDIGAWGMPDGSVQDPADGHLIKANPAVRVGMRF